ncbi:MAG: threonine ammonia-lyase [Deltaproteobacteria bacterium]
MVNLKQIKDAARKLRDVAYKTPSAYSYSLSDISGANVHLKLENLQRAGSFKIRGAYNKLSKIRRKVKNVIAASAGNHAQGVALAARLLGMNSTIVMPEITPINKILAVKSYGAEVILHGNNFDDAIHRAREVERESGDTFIHAFDDADIIAGQGTIGLEIADAVKNIDAVFVPIGGGGLISGIATAIKEINPRVRVIGVQSANIASMYMSIKKGEVVEAPSAQTIADGIAIKRPGGITLEIVKRHVDDIVRVEESEIEEALLLLTERKRIVVEGAGAAALAGLIKLKNDYRRRNVAVVVSGGNIDINTLAKIIDRGLARGGRVIKLMVEIPDLPGSLGKLSSLLGSVKANIVQIFHDRFSRELPIGRAIVEISLETKGFDHRTEILRLLKDNGYEPREKN